MDESIVKFFEENNVTPITLEEAIELLSKENNAEEYYKIREEGFRILTPAGEKKIMDILGGLIWITNYDSLSVPFYQAFDEKQRDKAKNADLLFGIGEVVGAGERHMNVSEVLEALEYHNVDRKEYEWYCAMKEKYPLKTSGFGMGIERFMLWILKHDDIRDCQLIPRFNGVNIIP
jgi:asparaginyl-tRNA synthetase